MRLAFCFGFIQNLPSLSLNISTESTSKTALGIVAKIEFVALTSLDTAGLGIPKIWSWTVSGFYVCEIWSMYVKFEIGLHCLMMNGIMMLLQMYTS